MTLKLYTGPSVEPITLAEAKLHLRVEHDADDSLISIYITAAREQAEHITGRALISQTWERVLDAFPALEIELGMPPVQAVSSITYLDATGATQTVSPANYALDNTTLPGWVLPAATYSWPATADTVNAVRVAFTCGYGASGASVPGAVRNWMLLHIGAAYRTRESFVHGQSVSELPNRYADALLDRLRTYQ